MCSAKEIKQMRNVILVMLLPICLFSCNEENDKPNILFVLMDDLGYGQFGIYNDTISVDDFDSFFVHLVDSLEGYSKEKSLEFSKIASPTLTNLAKNGLLFTNAYTSSNVCAPSRLGIATGTNQVKWGVYVNQDGEKQGIEKGTHLAEIIQKQGYKTAHIGKWHIGTRDSNIIKKEYGKFGVNLHPSNQKLEKECPELLTAIKNSGYVGSVIDEHHPLNNGFDYYYGYNHWGSQYYNSTLVWENFDHAGMQKGYNTDIFTDKAMKFMEKQIDDDKAFYVQLHYHAVHDSVEPRAPNDYLKNFDSNSFYLNNFYAHVYGVDYNVKRIVNLLKEKGEYENTLIVFASDNGGMCGGSYKGHKSGSPLPGNAPFSGHKGNYQQGGIRVPMFMHWAGKINSNTYDKLISSMDILPTAIDVAEGMVPKNIDGKSLKPLFDGSNTQIIHDHLFWAGIHSAKWGFSVMKTNKTHANEDRFSPPAWVVVKGNYLLRFTGSRIPGIYEDYWNGSEYEIELFNINKDPKELNNIASQHPKVVKELKKVFQSNLDKLSPPARWSQSKWEELKGSEKLLEYID